MQHKTCKISCDQIKISPTLDNQLIPYQRAHITQYVVHVFTQDCTYCTKYASTNIAT